MVAIDTEKVAIENIKATSSMKNKMLRLFHEFAPGYIFGRQDISMITGESLTTSGKIISKLKEAGLIESVTGHGKGKYGFRNISDSAERE